MEGTEDSMVKHKYDVVIVGARAAGASLAILLGNQGKKVLLIDKATFPSDTLSTHHLAHTQYLKALGVLESVEGNGLRRLERMRTYIGDSFIEGPKSEYSLAPRRNHLDSILVEKACEYENVTLYENTKLKSLIVEEEEVKGVEIQKEKGDSQDVFADLVVGADGVRSRVAKLVEAEKYKEQDPIRPVFYGYYEGIEPLPEPATEIFLNDGRIGFLFPMDPNMDCLGLEIHPEEFEEFSKNPKEAFEKVYQKHYGMKRRMQHAELKGKVVGTPGVPNFLRQPYGNGWALIGDAAYCKDPSTGLGVNDAFAQSFLLAEALKNIDEGEDWAQVMETFHTRRDEKMLPAYRLTLEYIQRLQPYSSEHLALFNALCANPIALSKLAPHLPNMLKDVSHNIPELYGSIEMEAEALDKK